MLHTAKHLGDQGEQTAAKPNKAQVRIYKSLRHDTFVTKQKTVNAHVTYVLGQILCIPVAVVEHFKVYFLFLQGVRTSAQKVSTA